MQERHFDRFWLDTLMSILHCHSSSKNQLYISAMHFDTISALSSLRFVQDDYPSLWLGSENIFEATPLHGTRLPDSYRGSFAICSLHLTRLTPAAIEELCKRQTAWIPQRVGWKFAWITSWLYWHYATIQPKRFGPASISVDCILADKIKHSASDRIADQK